VALEVALKAVGVAPLDEVIVPAYTFLATATAVTALGAIPVFADIDPATFTIDPHSVAKRVSPRTRAIVPVHLAGQPADMDGLVAIARANGLALVEDAAQAVGATWRGVGAGTIGDAGTLSFQSSKNLNAGEGGAILTNDDAIADRAWSLANCGRNPGGAWYQHDLAGSNHRLTELQAALLVSQMERLPTQMARRERSALILEAGLGAITGLTPQLRAAGVTTHARHLFVLRYDADAFGVRPRAWFLNAMRAEGIPCSPGYEVPLHRMPGVLAARRKWIEIARATGQHVSVPDHPDNEDLPATDHASRNAGVWFSQSLLLGDDEDMADVIHAARRIRAWCDVNPDPLATPSM
jgi:dTDP-4-amino-4,6-dideoxygalactose transaminase